MKFIDKIVGVLKRMFNKENKGLVEPQEEMKLDNINGKENINQEKQKQKFINSLKVDELKKNTKEVETLICDGDGMGINNTVSY